MLFFSDRIRIQMGVLCAMLCIVAGQAWSQSAEYERDLWVVPMEVSTEEMARPDFAVQVNRGGGMSLPFFDDFSTPSIPNASGVGFETYHRWENASARITQTFALLPPTIGVATLDGLDGDGYPYSFNDVNTSGWADTLTSLPIALGGYFPESNIHLMFYVQGGGRGNAPDPMEDELVLEFKSTDDVSGEEFWTEVWSTDSVPTETFERVFVSVDDPVYLSNGFQFRFRNFGALGGNVDLWHLDYVFLNDQMDPSVFEVVSEIAFYEPVNTLLRDYTRMPWIHFQSDPAFFMRDSLTTFQRNLSTTQADNIETGFTVDYDGQVSVNENFFQNTNVATETFFTTGFYVGNNPQGDDFIFDSSVNDSCAIFDVSFWESSIGMLHQEKVGVPDNDSITFQQVFINDYAYDDGSAEKAYSLTAAGGKIAMRYSIAQPDTLLGLAIHFTPYYTNSDVETFLLRAWADSAGIPGVELAENYQFHTPQYFTDGYDLFAYYEYDQPIPVDGLVHVGLVQGSEAFLNFGLDKNTNANVGQLHYQLGLGGQWSASEITGSVMLRPILRAGKTETWTEVEQWAIEADGGALWVYPNPSKSGEVSVAVTVPGSWSLWEISGRRVSSGNWLTAGVHQLSTAMCAPGMYVLRVDGGATARILIE